MSQPLALPAAGRRTLTRWRCLSWLWLRMALWSRMASVAVHLPSGGAQPRASSSSTRPPKLSASARTSASSKTMTLHAAARPSVGRRATSRGRFRSRSWWRRPYLSSAILVVSLPSGGAHVDASSWSASSSADSDSVRASSFTSASSKTRTLQAAARPSVGRRTVHRLRWRSWSRWRIDGNASIASCAVIFPGGGAQAPPRPGDAGPSSHRVPSSRPSASAKSRSSRSS
mmetsp:Transcript_9191/g.31477  ORF Transcript_9191/g.31477 Transcript_9191/m.31477 type:complete len:229 (+) Transcript_9191:21-707(+)